MFFITETAKKTNKKKKQQPKTRGIPLFLVLRRGYVRQGRERAFSCELNSVLCQTSSPPSSALPFPSIHLSVRHCAAYFKRSMSSCVRPRLSSCMVGSEARCGKALRSFSQHSSSRLGTASQILNREPVLLFSWMFTTPPWMYMQPVGVTAAQWK